MQAAVGPPGCLLCHLLGIEGSYPPLQQDALAILFDADASNFRNGTFRQQQFDAASYITKSRVDHRRAHPFAAEGSDREQRGECLGVKNQLTENMSLTISIAIQRMSSIAIDAIDEISITGNGKASILIATGGCPRRLARS